MDVSIKCFKNLIILDALIFVIILILGLFEPAEYADFMARTSEVIASERTYYFHNIDCNTYLYFESIFLLSIEKFSANHYIFYLSS